MKIRFLGHASFLIEDIRKDDKGKEIRIKVAIDPFKIKIREKVDYIFITHDHYDHCSPKDVSLLADPAQTIIVVPPDSSGKVKKYAKQVITVEPGREYDPGLAFRTVPAYNIGKNFHPRKNNWVGYIIYLSEIVYHSGDTDFIPEMQGLAPDVFLVPVGGTYTMNVKEAAEAVRAVKPRLVIPMHYGSVVGSRSDAEKLQKLVDVKVDVLEAE